MRGGRSRYRGGGSGNRATAKATCVNTSKSVSFRGAVDVDLIGQSVCE